MNATTEVSTDLARRIEEASLNAWPAMQQMFLDGWVLRLVNPREKRSKCSVEPLRGRDDFIFHQFPQNLL